MKKLIPVVFILFLVIGCAKKEEPVQFILTGRVRVNEKVNAEAKVKMELCKGTEWHKNESWNTTTDKWGAYSIVIGLDWFQCDYRVKVFAQDTVLFNYEEYYGNWDKMVNTYISDYQYGIVKWGIDTLNFALDDKKKVFRQEEIIEREGPQEKRYKDIK